LVKILERVVGRLDQLDNITASNSGSPQKDNLLKKKRKGLSSISISPEKKKQGRVYRWRKMKRRRRKMKRSQQKKRKKRRRKMRNPNDEAYI